MNTFFFFIATGKSALSIADSSGADAKVPSVLYERYAPAKEYTRITVNPDEWEYPSFGLIDVNGGNIDWNALWNAAYAHLTKKRGVPPDAAKAALNKTKAHGIGTFAILTGTVTFGVPVEETPV